MRLVPIAVLLGGVFLCLLATKAQAWVCGKHGEVLNGLHGTYTRDAVGHGPFQQRRRGGDPDLARG